MSNKQIFSVIIPMYNAERTIGRTLASLISNKDYIKEIIIVDDSSTDDSRNKIAPFRCFFNDIKIVNSTGFRNPGVARKTGMAYATGEWITFVDADDCLTPSSLRYVTDYLDDDTVLLHCMTIYYESGSFEAEHINFSDNSCGGNFYRRSYLEENNLYPHNILRKAEDEYFNTIVMYTIGLEDNADAVAYFDYPVYEVHHDFDDGNSYATSDWPEYAIKYHLLCQEYITDFFTYNSEMKDTLFNDFINRLSFCYLVEQALVCNKDEEFDPTRFNKDFNRAINYCMDTFDVSVDDIYDAYYGHDYNSSYNNVVASVGYEFEVTVPFRGLIEQVLNRGGKDGKR